MYFFHLLDYKYFSRISQLAVIIAVLLLILTLFIGNDINDAKRTITILGVTFQSSDFAKFALIMYIARYLSSNQEELGSYKGIGKILGTISLICVLIMPENLSTSLVLFFTCSMLLFIGNARLKHLGLLALSFIVAASIGLGILMNAPESVLPGRAATWKSRIENFKGTDSSESFQTTQAKIAIVGGGLTGKGPGKGEQSAYLPHPYSDFIFAVIIEEYGLLGGAFIIFIYLVFLFRCIRIFRKCPYAFGAFLALGLSFTLIIQAVANMAVNVAIVPVTGVTLPLLSMGGSSFIFTCCSIGLILSVARNVEQMEGKAPVETEIEIPNENIEPANA